MTPRARRREIRVIIRSAAAERNDVLDVPTFTSSDLPLADVAAATMGLEDAKNALRRHAPALLMLKAGACHSGISANVSPFAAFRSRIGGMMSATFNPVSASIVSATASNKAHAARCGSVSKLMLLLSIT